MNHSSQPSSPSPKRIPKYSEFKYIASELQQVLGRDDTQTLLMVFADKFDISHLPVAFLNLLAATPAGSIDFGSSKIVDEMRCLRAFLYRPPTSDEIRIVGDLLAPHFDQVSPILIDESKSLRASDRPTKDQDLTVKLCQVARQIEFLLMTASSARATARAMKIFEMAKQNGFPPLNRIVIRTEDESGGTE